uniref:SAP domain-containing protein n=1 Tax=Lotharella oceanica TaxID=641309 RepID=A0A7S2TNB1_9EUKA|mmetsp:Transcript_21715/g.40682  ORF Transcript_21715/g.40682 Transcript_21715/m.40682 type:complete len:238 (+) Transcript_21715:32-745(+)|eukprot:CAMPEP_0170175966 /NCGR_PEP_ID=MMETSP0040_2-20121228/8936_1 /TAXON_ID=641309 /ORGANISM="Lotharella oceanica, Strain CCMP622" /LENGTH=237 /DNA_ID=CAMNT_0010418131 /DNA_START=39 /DNA_END=752 /DNA_ORIENTATION=+
MPPKELRRWKKADLQAELKTLGLDTTGVRGVLIKRLEEARAAQEAAATEEAAPEPKTEEVKEEPAEEEKEEKEAPAEAEKEEVPEANEAAGSVVGVKAVAEISEEERKRKRAAKFGIPLKEDILKKRAEKFGLPTPAEKKKQLDEDAKKKAARAARFGLLGGKELSEEEKKKIEARRARFGEVNVDPAYLKKGNGPKGRGKKRKNGAQGKKTTSSAPLSAEEAEKRRKRAAKFGPLS